MGNFAVVLSIIIVFGVSYFEFLRPKNNHVIDYISGVNFVYVMAFGIVPLFVYYFFDFTTWQTIRNSNFNHISFLKGVFYSIIFYLCVVLAYYSARKLKLIKQSESFSKNLFLNIRDQQLIIVSLFLFLLGFFSLFYYIGVVGGLEKYLQLGAILRSNGNYIQSPFMFLKNVIPVLYMSCFLFYALFIKTKGRARFFHFFLFLFALGGSVLHLYHSSGRMSLFTFLITFVLAHVIYKNKLRLSTLVIGTILFIAITTLGDTVMNSNSSASVSEVLESSFKNSGETVASIIEEFSFPYTNIGNNIQLFPYYYDFRYGLRDILIGFNDILPNRLIPLDFLEGESMTDFNTNQFGSTGAIPVDAVTFGFVSFGLAGVIIEGIFFGFSVRLLESMFFFKGNFVASILAAKWMSFIAFRVMYADSGHVLDSAFELIIVTVLLYMISILNSRQLDITCRTKMKEVVRT